jgi:hypothetical protein
MSSEINDPSNALGETAPPSRRQKAYSKRADRKGVALTLAQEIKRLQERPEFAEFRADLETAIRRVRFSGGRTPTSDRDLVLASLEESDRMNVAATLADIIGDTTLERKAVKEILDEFVMSDLVEMYERPEQKRGPKVMLYKLLRGPRADVAHSPAFARMKRSTDFADEGERRTA